jgi:hypothetical protein
VFEGGLGIISKKKGDKTQRLRWATVISDPLAILSSVPEEGPKICGGTKRKITPFSRKGFASGAA